MVKDAVTVLEIVTGAVVPFNHADAYDTGILSEEGVYTNRALADRQITFKAEGMDRMFV